MNISLYIDSRFSVVVKEFDEIYHHGKNESSKFISLLQLFHVLEENSGSRDSFSREHGSYWSLRIMLLKFSSCSPFLNSSVAISD